MAHLILASVDDYAEIAKTVRHRLSASMELPGDARALPAAV
jgi:hypothetical protein